MITSIENRATIGKVMALSLLMAILLATLLSAVPAGAAGTSGKAFAWGDNYDGQLGNGQSGDGTDATIPIAVSNLSGVKSVKAGCSHGLALKTDGTVRTWGSGGYGVLGNGTNNPSSVPVKAKIENVKAISAGCNHNLALKENGTVWAWGNNEVGELGNGTSGPGAYSSVPVKVANISTGARSIAAGSDFSLALMQDGTVKSWGSNSDGQLGNGVDAGMIRSKPGPVSNLSNVKAIATDSTARHALALKTDGTVRSWGDNVTGQLGDGASLPGTYEAKPVRVANLTGVQAIATGGYHSLALMGSGRVKSWGSNSDGQLGNDASGPGTDRSTPGNVIGLDNVRSISGGQSHSLAVLESGPSRSWGYNYEGQLGNGTSENYTDVPVAVKNLTNVRNIDGGYQFTLAATE